MTAPNRNAPKIAWTPIASVASAAASIAASVSAIGPARRLAVAGRARPAARRAAAPREHQRDERQRQDATTSAPPGARLHDADDERQQAPRRHVVDRRARQRDDAERACCVMPRSARMRASTGNAVIDIATPMNSAKLVNGTSLVEKRG